ncbi:uncharacterized protein LOC125297301 isoform X1 [Alosa alosa]|uniref:uncharacterized protein LOC125297301 isoform X1 n=1 Tax=Alosa alosa TaxID=278164 RepID=UPI0020150431|nr:uncharacterized protein LOC125297301 isoform X1 [Alosa alosa]
MNGQRARADDGFANFLDLLLRIWNLITQVRKTILAFFQSSPPSALPLLEKDWRPINWMIRNDLKEETRTVEPSNPGVEHLRILVHGPVGAGKSSFINSVDSIFQGRMTSPALTETASDCSFTSIFRTHKIKDGHYGTCVPFVLCDIMGLEKGDLQGAHPDDLIKVLHGHIRDGHKFKSAVSLSENDPHYNASPSLSDKVHCLVSVIPASKISLIDDSIIQKIKLVRKKASELGVPQVVVMTYVDEACPHVKEDLGSVYRSHKIKEKMHECSSKVGVPMSLIFPVKNYHDEEELNEMIDTLLLRALKQIVLLANDYIYDLHPTPRENQLDREWRRIRWEPSASLSELRSLCMGNPEVSRLRLLLCGPMGVGKSSFINSVSSVLQGRVTTPAPAANSTAGFTTRYKNYSFKNGSSGPLPFVIADVMGLEGGDKAGALVDDLTNALKGRIKDGYQFNPVSPLSDEGSYYNSSPSLADQAHCLLMVVSAEHISSLDESLITKIKTVRQRAHDIPQAVVMTMVDRVSPLVREDLREMYTSKTIKDKMEECSELLGVPLSSIFPVKNYHEEMELDDKMDAVITHTLSHILTLANDYVSSKAE